MSLSISSKKRGSSVLSAAAASSSSSAAASSVPSWLSSIPSSLPSTPTYTRNSAGFRAGSIVRVKMVNFMAYDQVEMFPGPGLNLLLGPNGSGKSTCVSAIGIALGGDIKSMGRFDKLSQYVKCGHSEAIVEIELFACASATSTRNLIISRHFTSEGEDKWYLGNAVGSLKLAKKMEIAAEMKRLNIQINNLCVYLAQFRVGHFAEMNEVKLLEETERAADPKLFMQHQSIIENVAKANKLSEVERQEFKQKDALQNDLKKLDEEMKLQSEREETEKKIVLLKQRLPWCKYDKQMKIVESKKKYRDELNVQLEAEKKKQAPLQRALKKKEAERESAKTARHTAHSSLTNAKKLQADYRKDVESLGERLDELETKAEDLEKEERKRVQQLAHERARLAEAKEEFAKLRSTEVINAERMKVQDALFKVREEENELAKENNALQQAAIEANTDKTNLERSAQSLLQRPVVDPMRQIMRAMNDRGLAEKELMAVESMKREHKLKGKVHGPLIACIKLKTPKIAMYVESIITGNKRTAYIAEDAADVDVLRGAGIRFVIHAPPLEAPRRFANIEPLRARYGLRWLDEDIECDDYVRSALYDVLNFANYPYSSVALTPADKAALLPTNKHERKLPSLFVGNEQYSCEISQWTDDVATRTSNGVSAEEEESIKNQMAEIQAKIDQATKTIADIEVKKREVKERFGQSHAARVKIKEEGNNKLASLLKERQSRAPLQARIDACQRAIDELDRRVSIADLRDELQRHIQETERKRMSRVMQLIDADTQVHALLDEVTHTSMHFHTADREYFTINDRITMMSRAGSALSESIRTANAAVISASQQAESFKAAALLGAKRDVFKGLNWMEDDITEERACALYDELSSALRRTIGDASIRDRHERLQRDSMQADSRHALVAADLENIQNNLKQTKSTWEAAVRKMVSIINERFSSYFTRIGCAGKVELKCDGEVFGLEISVSFRKNLPPVRLSASSQSGGEKSVATMLYLLTLQEVTDCPFRMVDEINQGMDANNERTVFDQIVRACEGNETAAAAATAAAAGQRRAESKSDMEGREEEEEEEAEAERQLKKGTPQYFVVTPKLLPNLSFSRRVTVFNVYSGRLVTNQKEWDMERFIKIAMSGNLEEQIKKKKQKRIEAEQRAELEERMQGSQLQGSQQDDMQ